MLPLDICQVVLWYRNIEEVICDADFWNTPLLLSSFAKRNIRTINPYYSKLWVQQRIIPSVVGAYLEKFEKRYRFKVEDVVPLENTKLLVFFRDGVVKKCDAKELLGERYKGIWNSPELFNKVSIQIGGYGVDWGESALFQMRNYTHQG